MRIQRFAIVYGIVFLLVGMAGFIPGATSPHSHPDVQVNNGLGLLFGLFPVNVLHNAVHLLFGLWGLAAARGVGASRWYARAVTVIYAVLAVMGLIPQMNVHTTFGLIPLYGNDIWLHLALALAAAYFGFVREEPTRRGTVAG